MCYGNRMIIETSLALVGGASVNTTITQSLHNNTTIVLQSVASHRPALALARAY
jgi:hypothetical protein